MRFLQPDQANWLLSIPLAFLFWFLYVRTKKRFRHQAGITGHLQDLSHLTSSTGDTAVLLAAVTAIGMLVLAMTRPQVYLDLQLPQYQKHDLILMLDRSASMYAQDVKPNRFNRAIEEIKAFLKKKPENIDRIALIGFAGTPIVLSRLTADLNSLYFYLDWIRDDARLYWGTDIGEALKYAMQLADKDYQKTPKIYVVLSDGEDFGENLQKALAEVRKKGVRVHTIGIGGDSDVPIPVYEQGKQVLLRDDNDKIMQTHFSPTTLTMIAQTTGGRYFRSVSGTELLDAMNDIVSFERKLVGWQSSGKYRDLYREALLVAALATSFLLIKL
jgi:Ca-activated chloride channel family protein